MSVVNFSKYFEVFEVDAVTKKVDTYQKFLVCLRRGYQVLNKFPWTDDGRPVGQK